ncbi:MAG: hypothetical protein WCK37_02140 [Candidatus Falkowbacteria bacterium]
MKKSWIIILLLFIILIPAAAHAWSWRDLFFWEKPVTPVVVNVAPEVKVFGDREKVQAAAKYKAWTKAYKTNDLKLVLASSTNLSFSEEEINYLMGQEIASTKKPDLKDPHVIISEGKIAFSGFSLIKYLTGEFAVSGSLVSTDKDLSFAIDNATYHGLPVPSSLANMVFNKLGTKFFTLLKTYPNYKGVNIDISDKKVIFSFK